MKFKDQLYIFLCAIFISSLVTCNLIANKLSSVYLSDLLDREEEDRSSDVPNYSI